MRVLYVFVGVVIGVIAGAALGLHAQQDQTVPSEDTASAAAEANVDPAQLVAALDTLAAADIPTDARSYLESTGELARPEPPPAPRFTPSFTTPAGWPIGGALGARIFCIEAIESSHGRAMYNPRPVWTGEHASGWLGFLPSTARRWGAVVGNRASEWAAAARMIRAGAGSQFAGIAWGRC